MIGRLFSCAEYAIIVQSAENYQRGVQVAVALFVDSFFTK